MSERDPRVDLSDDLLPAHAMAAVQALDSVRVRIVPGTSPASALVAGSLLVLVARTHAHVELAGDADLPANPWGAPRLSTLLENLNGLRPAPQAQPVTMVTIGTGIEAGADRYIAASTWTVSVTPAPATGATQEATEEATDVAGETETPARAGLAGERLLVAPFGGMFAAAVVAAELFRDALAPLGLLASPRRTTFVWNLLDYTYAPAPPAILATARPTPLWPASMLAGCGSVGSSAAAALACGDLDGMVATTIDGDVFDPARNAFRYPAADTTTGPNPKATWVSAMLSAAGARTDPVVGGVRSWTTVQPEPGFDGIVVSSVDDVDGRYEVADVLARTTLSAAVHALSFHVQREHLGDGLACPFCDFVTVASPMAQATADAQLTGLEEQRIIELLHHDGRLTKADVDRMVNLGKLTAETAQGLVGGRLADLRNRVYAQANIPAADPAAAAPPAPLSAPYVSWATGVLLAAEVAKHAYGLAPVNRRVEVDLHGYPADFVHIRPADGSGRCACARAVRVRWMRKLYPDMRDESAAN